MSEKTYTLTVTCTDGRDIADADGNDNLSLLEEDFQKFLRQQQWKKADAKITVDSLVVT